MTDSDTNSDETQAGWLWFWLGIMRTENSFSLLILFLYFTYLILIWFSILENDQFSLWRKKSKFCLRIRLCWNNITGAIRHIDDYRREVQLMIDCLNDWVIIHYSGGDDRFFIQLFSSYPFYSNTIHWLWLVGVTIRGLGWCKRFCHLLICNKGDNFNQDGD